MSDKPLPPFCELSEEEQVRIGLLIGNLIAHIVNSPKLVKPVERR